MEIMYMKTSVWLMILAVALLMAGQAVVADPSYATWNIYNSTGSQFSSGSDGHCFVCLYYQNYTLAPRLDSNGDISTSTPACGGWYGFAAYALKDGNYYAYVTCRQGSQRYNSYVDAFSYANGPNGTIAYQKNVTVYPVSDWSVDLTLLNSTVSGNSTLKVIVNGVGLTEPVNNPNMEYQQEDLTTHSPFIKTFAGQILPNDNVLYVVNPWIGDIQPNLYNTSFCGPQSIFASMRDSYGSIKASSTQGFTITGCTIPTVTTTPSAGVNGSFLGPVPQIDAAAWQSAGYGWLTPFFSVFFMGTMILVVVVAAAGFVGGPMGAGAAVLAMLIAYSVLGIYPIWVVIILGLGASAVMVQLLRSGIGGK
jgi:hypothetical protein